MSIIPNTIEEPPPRELLIIDVMLALDDAIEGEDPVSSYDLAAKLVDLIEPRVGALTAAET